MVEILQLRKQLKDAVTGLGFTNDAALGAVGGGGSGGGGSGGGSDDQLPQGLATVPLFGGGSGGGGQGLGQGRGSVLVAVRGLGPWRLLGAALCGALWPNVVKVRRPVLRYHETKGGAVEADPEARELKFQVQRAGAGSGGGGGSGRGFGGSGGGGPGGGASCGGGPTCVEDRVWLHPGSALFSERKFGSPFLVFNELATTSRPFVRDATEVSPFALLLFGGPSVVVDVAKRTVAVVTPAAEAAAAAAAAAASSSSSSSSSSQTSSPGWASGEDWCRFSAAPRVGALVGAMRSKLDALLALKVSQPGLAINQDPAAAAIVRLLVTEGMG